MKKIGVIVHQVSTKHQNTYNIHKYYNYGGVGFKVSDLRVGLSKGSQSVFKRVSEKSTENSKRLGRQARPRLESGTSRFPVLSVTALPLMGHSVFWIH